MTNDRKKAKIRTWGVTTGQKDDQDANLYETIAGHIILCVQA